MTYRIPLCPWSITFASVRGHCLQPCHPSSLNPLRNSGPLASITEHGTSYSCGKTITSFWTCAPSNKLLWPGLESLRFASVHPQAPLLPLAGLHRFLSVAALNQNWLTRSSKDRMLPEPHELSVDAGKCWELSTTPCVGQTATMAMAVETL